MIKISQPKQSWVPLISETGGAKQREIIISQDLRNRILRFSQREAQQHKIQLIDLTFAALEHINQIQFINNINPAKEGNTTMAQQFSIETFIFILILIIYVLTAHLIEVQKIPFLHESTVAIIMGLLTAVFVKYGLDGQIVFNNDIFFAIILPPIIFSAGYSLRKSLFFQNFGIISFLGVIGTIVAFILICVFVYIINRFIFNQALTLKEFMLLSTVLCATDTVAAMSLIKPEKYPVLNAVLFGEGIINDAVAIVLFRTVAGLQLDSNNGITFEIVLWMIFDFLVLTMFSLAIGALFGFGLSYLFKVNESFNRYPIKQTSLILLTGYISYLVGQLLGFSGIITLFTCSIIMGHYAFMNISEQSQRGTGLAFQTVSYIAEAFVYAYLGASILGIQGKGLAIGFAALVLVFLPFARAAMIYILPGIYYIRKKPFPLNPPELKVCWYSGLVRGVIAFALALQVESMNQDFVVTVVLFTVLITTILGSSFLKSFCDCIGLKSEIDLSVAQSHGGLGKSLMDESEYRGPQFDLDSGTQGDHKGKEENGNRSIKQKFQHFQNQYMKPLFKKTHSQQFNYDIQISDIGNEMRSQKNA